MFKKLTGYDYNYLISQDGKIFNVSKNRYLSLSTNPNGFTYVTLVKDGKYITKLLARLVAEIYCDNPLNKKYVVYKDHDKNNINSHNLMWCNKNERITHYQTKHSREGTRTDQIKDLPLCPKCGARLYCFRSDEELDNSKPVFHICCVNANIYTERKSFCDFYVSSHISYKEAFEILKIKTGDKK